MIVLDTNVVSELMRPAPHPAVLAWVDSHAGTDQYLTSMTAGELLFGVARLPIGRRRELLAQKVADLLGKLFLGRILPFDSNAAVEYARIVAARERAGNSIGVADGVIAATAAAAQADVLVTRNIADFADVGLAVLDPWGA